MNIKFYLHTVIKQSELRNVFGHLVTHVFLQINKNRSIHCIHSLIPVNAYLNYIFALLNVFIFGGLYTIRKIDIWREKALNIDSPIQKNRKSGKQCQKIVSMPVLGNHKMIQAARCVTSSLVISFFLMYLNLESLDFVKIQSSLGYRKKKPGLKQANTSMSVPPLASYKWAIKHKRNRKTTENQA